MRNLEATGVPTARQAARKAGLRYADRHVPGIRRIAVGKGFRYVGVTGRPVSAQARRRIEGLVIPPAWREVWICPHPQGHIQATGLDQRGRRQYLYHAKWRTMRTQTNFARMAPFAKALPRIRRRIQHDLAAPGMTRAKVLGALVWLLDRTGMRVGNEEYAKENHSFGLTTLRNRHARVRGSRMQFEFNGKSGVHHHVEIRHKRLARIVKQCQELPGQDLFSFVDDTGKAHGVNSGQVNEYLQETCGEEFTAKDFRTWQATLHGARALCACGAGASETELRRNVVEAVKVTAAVLGNRPAVCRKYYMHPVVIESYMAQRLGEVVRDAPAAGALTAARGLSGFEKAVVRLLRGGNGRR